MESCLEQLRELLNGEAVAYEVIAHPEAATAQEAAAGSGISGYSFAKPVVLMVNEQPELFVLRAADRIDMESLRRHFSPASIRIAAEYETHPLFPGCESGGIPAIPLQGDLPVHVDRKLSSEPAIVFEAGSSTQAVRMQMSDYMRIVRPQLLDFAEAPSRSRRVTRRMMRRRRAMQVLPFAAAILTMLFGPRLMRRRSGQLRALAAGILAGAATSTLTEPRSGGRRRALLRDKPRRWMRQSSRIVNNRARYMAGTMRGVWVRSGAPVQRAIGQRGRPMAAPRLHLRSKRESARHAS